MAPEVLEGCAPTPASDVYSLGVVVLQLLTGSEPNGLVQHMTGAARTGHIKRTTDPCAGGWPSEDAAELCQLALRCCLTLLSSLAVSLRSADQNKDEHPQITTSIRSSSSLFLVP